MTLDPQAIEAEHYRETWPKRIYLVLDDEVVNFEPKNRIYPRQADTYWCQDRVSEHDIEYVRADSLKGQVGGWQPIETALHETWLLLAGQFGREGWRIKQGSFYDGKWNLFDASWEPTHWKPLPPPPSKEADHG